MLISALSLGIPHVPTAALLPSFGANQRLADSNPSSNLTSMAAQSQLASMEMLLTGMALMLRGLMAGAAHSAPNSSAMLQGATPTPLGTASNPVGQARDSSPVSRGSASATDLNQAQGSDFGKKFAAQAEKTANQINTPGLCLKGVNDTMQAMGLPVHREAAAWMAVDDFQKNPKFKEVKVSKDQLKSLPAGAVVIWDKGAGLPYGHISVSLGDGREASSKVRQQLLLNTNYHVFLPN